MILEYNEEIDAVLKFLKSPQPLSVGSAGTSVLRNIDHGGCGKVYDNIVCYSHSTGTHCRELRRPAR